MAAGWKVLTLLSLLVMTHHQLNMGTKGRFIKRLGASELKGPEAIYQLINQLNIQQFYIVSTLYLHGLCLSQNKQ
jgi:hypothetical protein